MGDAGRLDCDRILRLLRPGMRVFIHAGPAESPALLDALRRAPAAAEGVDFVGAFIPGVNDTDYASFHATAHSTGFFVPPVSRSAFASGRHDFVPIAYGAIGAYLDCHPVDLAILHLPPDEGGVFSWGLSADVAPFAAARAARVAVIVNAQLPRSRGEVGLDTARVDLFVDGEAPPRCFINPPSDPATAIIAAHVAALIEDGDTIQFGIGKIPAAVLPALTGRRGLRLHSGIVTDEVAQLVEAGTIASGGRGDGLPPIVAGMALGAARARALAGHPAVGLYSTAITHNPALIAGIDGFVAINSAIEVDLFGQVNGETVAGRQISGVGGSAEFARAARLGRRGRALIALSATARGRSRIVPLVAGPPGITRADADIVVTEFGVARVRHLGLDRRAEALIAIAAPEHRGELARAWGRLRAEL